MVYLEKDCCPVYDCMCDYDLCQEAPICAENEILRSITEPSNCCTTFYCEGQSCDVTEETEFLTVEDCVSLEPIILTSCEG